MGLFGWSLPPGVSMRDIDPPEGPCEVCGLGLDQCICPECPKCGEIGNPDCYASHGLVRSTGQVQSKAKADAELAHALTAEQAYWEQLEQESRREDK